MLFFCTFYAGKGLEIRMFTNIVVSVFGENVYIYYGKI